VKVWALEGFSGRHHPFTYRKGECIGELFWHGESMRTCCVEPNHRSKCVKEPWDG
jgi:hypothetical protein